MSYFLTDKVDYEKHNAAVREVWDLYDKGKPARVPVRVYGSIRYFIQNAELNTEGWTFRQFFEDIITQIKTQVAYQKWCRHNILCDHEMGMPQKGWSVHVDFQNSLDAAWMGCPLIYPDGAVPDTLPILAADKNLLYKFPEWLDQQAGLMGRAIEFYEQMHDMAKHLEFDGLPIIATSGVPGETTDGPLDLAYKLRGADNLLVDMLTDEDYYHDLMNYITENLIRRMKKMREYRWNKMGMVYDRTSYKQSGFSFADDAIALLSHQQYKDYVYPYHKRIFDEFSDGSAASIHLCGDATRHFVFLRDAFNIRAFDTGFPIDHGLLRRILGEEVTIHGGPTIMELQYGTTGGIRREVKRICESGIMSGGRFIMIAANNLAPMTPVENVKALYEATCEYGRYH